MEKYSRTPITDQVALSRRQACLVLSSAVASSIALPHLELNGHQPILPAPDGLTLGFSTYGMKTLKTEQALKMLAEIGFDAVELTIWKGWDADPASMNTVRRRSLRKLLDQSGLVLTSLMEHVFPLDPKQQANALNRLKLATDLGHELCPNAPPIVQTVLGSGNFEKNKNLLVDRLGEWVKLADSAKSIIAIKPHRGGLVSKPDEAVWLLEQLGKPARLRMVYDYSHYVFRGMSIDETVERSAPYTSHIAVKDAVQVGDKVVFKLPGQSGTIDFSKILSLFYKKGYRGDINCEVSGMVWSQKNYDPKVAAETCYANLSKAFELAGVPRKKT